MVIKRFLFLFVLFSFTIVFSQENIIVNYEYKEFGRGIKLGDEDHYLFSSGGETYYFGYTENFNGIGFKNKNLFQGVLTMKYLNNQKLVEYKWKVSPGYFVIDDVPNFIWSLKDEYKDILGYHCQKAITKFRGREYEVFFTKEISLNIGPWKLNGLPGLILEAKSVDKMFAFKAKKIYLNTEIKLPKFLSYAFDKYKDKQISYKEYIEKENILFKDIKRRLISNGRFKTNSEISSIRELDLELNFEWE